MVGFSSSGKFEKTIAFLEFLKSAKPFDIFDHYGRMGVDALSRATPIETGDTAHSWGYEVTHTNTSHTIHWFNTHDVEGVNIAVILQYGHGTGTGGYVEGRDYINPAMQPLFDKMVDEIWKQVRDG